MSNAFTPKDPEVLRRQLDRFTIPMFLAKLNVSTSKFVMVTINDAQEEGSGLLMNTAIDRALSDLLPPEQTANSIQHYSECLRSDAPVRHPEKFKLQGGTTIWDTSLCRLTLPCRRLRNIGTTLVVHLVTRNAAEAGFGHSQRCRGRCAGTGPVGRHCRCFWPNCLAA